MTSLNPDIRPTVVKAINLQRQIDKLSAQLDPLKSALREYAGGDTGTFELKGKGSILVSKPQKATYVTKLTADETAFQALPEVKRDQILRLSGGAIAFGKKRQSGKAASVKIKPSV